MAFLPEAAFEFLRRADERGRLAHAYLIAGEPGSGKRPLAMRLASLATKVEGGWGEAMDPSKHPDVHAVEPESKSRVIRVEQTRELEKELQMRSSLGGRKVGIIFDAERMNAAASNSFLKTLEEPPANSLLLLLTAHPEMLLDTILSRCILLQLVAAPHREPTVEQRRLLDATARFFEQPAAGLGEVFVFVREFTLLLAETKTAIQGEAAAEWKREEALYKQTTDGRWLAEREDYFKTLGESRYLQARDVFVETLLQWWGDVLRQQQGVEVLDFPAYAANIAALAARLGTPESLRRISALEALRENFKRNVQEQLAIEVAFLGAFGNEPKQR
jgi:DNA polymerase-3 subunit delta'